jgi:transcriptional regulator with XRE-family HTH domain
MPRTPTPLGQRVRALRQQQGLSQTALAELTGGRVDRDYIAALETGRVKSMGSDKATALAGALGVSLDYLLTGAAGPGERTRLEVNSENAPTFARMDRRFPRWLLDDLEKIGITLLYARSPQPGAEPQPEGQEDHGDDDEHEDEAPERGPE